MQPAVRPVQQLEWLPAVEPGAELIGSAAPPEHPLLSMLRERYGLSGSGASKSSRSNSAGTLSRDSITTEAEGEVPRPGRRLTQFVIRPRPSPPPRPPSPPSPPPPPPPPPVPPAPECACQMHQDYVFASVPSWSRKLGSGWTASVRPGSACARPSSSASQQSCWHAFWSTALGAACPVSQQRQPAARLSPLPSLIHILAGGFEELYGSSRGEWTNAGAESGLFAAGWGGYLQPGQSCQEASLVGAPASACSAVATSRRPRLEC